MSDCKDGLKKCRKCGCSKPADTKYFYGDSKGKNGLSSQCKECKNERGRINYYSDIDKTRKRCRAAAKKWRENNVEKNRERARLWAKNNPDRIDRQKQNKTSRDWAKNNPDKIKKWHDSWRNNNPKKIKIYSKTAYIKIRGTPKGRLNCSIKSSIYRSLSGEKKGRKWESLVGYTLNDLTIHLERQFKPNMSWENYGKWHVDHKIPISVFNYSSAEDTDFKRCWALKNLQPLWATDNLIKNNKLEKHFQPCLSFSPAQGGYCV